MVREKVKASSYFLQFIFVYLYSTYVLSNKVRQLLLTGCISKETINIQFQMSFLRDLELTPGRMVGENHPTFIIAEIGQNHQGNLLLRVSTGGKVINLEYNVL